MVTIHSAPGGKPGRGSRGVERVVWSLSRSIASYRRPHELHRRPSYRFFRALLQEDAKEEIVVDFAGHCWSAGKQSWVLLCSQLNLWIFEIRHSLDSRICNQNVVENCLRDLLDVAIATPQDDNKRSNDSTSSILWCAPSYSQVQDDRPKQDGGL